MWGQRRTHRCDRQKHWWMSLATEVLKLSKRHQSDRGVNLKLVDCYQAGLAYTWSGRSKFVYFVYFHFFNAQHMQFPGLPELIGQLMIRAFFLEVPAESILEPT